MTLDKNEFTMKLEEIDALAERGDFESAAAVADTVDWRRVRNLRTLCTVAEIYEACKRYDDSLAMLQIAYKRPGNSKSVVYRLAEMYIRVENFDEAERYIREYKQLSPHDMSRYILLYKLARAKKAPLDDQIAILRTYKDREYTERWAYELARLYHQNGQDERCVSECDDMILWFSQGKYVLRAMDLKRQIQPLTAEQEALYNKEKDRLRMEAEAAEAARLAKEKQAEEEAKARELREKEEAEAKARALEEKRRREEALREAEELNRVEPGSTVAAIDKLDAAADQALAEASPLANAPNVAMPARQLFPDEPPTEEQEMLASSIREVFADMRGTANADAAEEADTTIDDLLTETNSTFAEELSKGDYRRLADEPTAEEEAAWNEKETPKADELAHGETLAEAVAAALAAGAAAAGVSEIPEGMAAGETEIPEGMAVGETEIPEGMAVGEPEIPEGMTAGETGIPKTDKDAEQKDSYMYADGLEGALGGWEEAMGGQALKMEETAVDTPENILVEEEKLSARTAEDRTDESEGAAAETVGESVGAPVSADPADEMMNAAVEAAMNDLADKTSKTSGAAEEASRQAAEASGAMAGISAMTEEAVEPTADIAGQAAEALEQAEAAEATGAAEETADEGKETDAGVAGAAALGAVGAIAGATENAAPAFEASAGLEKAAEMAEAEAAAETVTGVEADAVGKRVTAVGTEEDPATENDDILSWRSWGMVSTEDAADDDFDFSTWEAVDFLGGSGRMLSEVPADTADVLPGEANGWTDGDALTAAETLPEMPAADSVPRKLLNEEAADEDETAVRALVEGVSKEDAEVLTLIDNAAESVDSEEVSEKLSGSDAVSEDARMDAAEEEMSEEKSAGGIGAAVAAAGILAGGAALVGAAVSGAAHVAGAAVAGVAGAEAAAGLAGAAKTAETAEALGAGAAGAEAAETLGNGAAESAGAAGAEAAAELAGAEKTAEALGIGVAGLAGVAGAAALADTDDKRELPFTFFGSDGKSLEDMKTSTASSIIPDETDEYESRAESFRDIQEALYGREGVAEPAAETGEDVFGSAAGQPDAAAPEAVAAFAQADAAAPEAVEASAQTEAAAPEAVEASVGTEAAAPEAGEASGMDAGGLAAGGIAAAGIAAGIAGALAENGTDKPAAAFANNTEEIGPEAGIVPGAAAAALAETAEANAGEAPAEPENDVLANNGFEFVDFTNGEEPDASENNDPNSPEQTDDEAFVDEILGVVKRPVEPRPLDVTETELLSYFSRIPGIPEQVTMAMADVYNHSGERTSNRGNILIMGRPGSGKSRLAEGMILAMGRDLGINAVKSARLTAQEMNQKDAAVVIGKMAGGFLVIEAAGSLRDDVVESMSEAMEFRTDGLVIILEDERKELRKMLARHPGFSEKFTSEVAVPVFTNDELVMFAKTYAKERGYKLDEMAVIALYTEIGENQRDEEPVTVGMVRMMIDRAINRTASHRFGRRRIVDTDGRIILREKDFDY